MPRLMRRLARPVDAQVGYDDAIAVRGDARRGAELDPVDLGARKQAVEQHDRRALAHLAPRQSHAVARVEKLGFDAHASGLWTFRSEEHTSELQSLMRISYAVFCLKKKNTKHAKPPQIIY